MPKTKKNHRTKELHPTQNKAGSLFYQWTGKVEGLKTFGQAKVACTGLRSGETVRTYLSAGQDFCKWVKANRGYKDLTQVNLEDCAAYLAVRQSSGLSAWTLSRDRTALTRILGFDSQQLSIPERKAADVKRGRGPERAVADKYQPMVAFLRASGLRRHEAQLLEARDINVAAGTVTVRRGKGGRSRTVNLLDKNILSKIQLDNKAPTDRVFDLLPKSINVHGYRRQFAQALFQRLAGAAYGNAKLDQNVVRRALAQVSQELGHGSGRLSLVRNYYLK